MARIDNLTNFLTDIANSIRNKKGTSEPIEAKNFDTEIASIETGGSGTLNLQDKNITITSNGTQNIEADEGYDGLNTVNITTNVEGVDVPEFGLVPSKFDYEGFPTDFTFYGFGDITIPNDYYENLQGTYFNRRTTTTPKFADSITSIELGTNCFSMCNLFTSISFGNKPITFKTSGISNVIGGSSSTFYNNTKVTNIDLSTMTSIILPGRICSGCNNLQTMVLPDNITTINGRAFENCSKLTTINLPSTLEEIKGYAFYNCSKLALTELPENITSLGGTENYNNYTFSGCSNLALTSLPNKITLIPYGCFKGCTKLELINLPSNLVSIENEGFSGCTNIKLSSLPNTLTDIKSKAFYNCSNISLTNLPENLKTLGASAFYNCTSINITTLPDTITILESNVFRGCNGLKKISFSNVTQITGSTTSNSTFNQCTNLTKLWIGSAITTMGRYSLYINTNYPLTHVYIDLPRATVETLPNYNYAFMNNASKQDIIICNDDEDFLTKEEFDAIDWSTYTEGE